MSKRSTSLLAIAVAAFIAWPTNVSAQRSLMRSGLPAVRTLSAEQQHKQEEALSHSPLKERRILPQSRKQAQAVKENLAGSILTQKPVSKRPSFIPTAPQVLTVGGTEIWVNTANANQDTYIKSLISTNPNQKEILVDDYNAYFPNGMSLSNGKIYGAYLESFWGMYFPGLSIIDTETWEFDVDFDILDDYTLMATETASAPDGTVYGLFYDANGYLEWGKADFENRTHERIGSSTNFPVALGVTKKHDLYMVATDGNLYKIDTMTGAETLIGSTGFQESDLVNSQGQYYYQCGEIDSRTNTFFWFAQFIDGTQGLYTVNLKTGAATKISDLDGTESYLAAVIPAPAAADKAPAQINDLNAIFEEASLEGVATFTAPTTTFAGNSFSSVVSYAIVANNDTIDKGLARAGEAVKANFTAQEGENTITAITANAWGFSPIATTKVWAGYDLPLPATDVKLSVDEDNVATLTWNYSKEGQHGGFVGDLTFDVYQLVNGEKTLVAEGLTETTFTEKLSLGIISEYAYGVVVKNAKAEAAMVTSDGIVLGNPITVPYEEDFSNNSLSLFTIIDANGDGSSWYYNDYSKYVYYRYHTTNSANDWLITPPIQLKAGRTYTFSTNTQNYWSTTYPERFEVKMGNDATVAAMTTQVIEATDLTDTNPHDFENTEISVSEDGTYYFGIHAISDPNEYLLIVNSISVKANPTSESPEAVGIQVTPDANGASQATVVLTAPSKNKGGNDLTGTLSIDLKRDGINIQSFEDVAPGAEITYVDETTNGIHTYAAYATQGENDGMEGEKVTVFVGMDIPANIEEVKVSGVNDVVSLSWNKVGAVGANGGLVRPDEVSYLIWSYDSDGYQQDVIDSLTNIDSYTIEYPTEEGDQTFAYWGVQPVNEVGQGAVTVGSTLVGTPYSMPFEEHFAGGSLSYSWFWERTDLTSGAFSLALSTDNSSDNDGNSVKLTCNVSDESASLFTGKIAPQKGAVNPIVSFDFLNENANDVISLIVEKANGEQVTLAKANGGSNSYQTLKANLSEYLNEPFLKFYFKTDFSDAGISYYDNIVVFDQLEENLAVSATAPNVISAGNKADIAITVRNLGSNNVKAGSYSLKVTVDGKDVPVNQTSYVAIPSMGSADYTATYTTDIFTKGGSKEIKVEAIYANDLDEDDNVAEAAITVNEPGNPGPESVSYSNGTISWVADDNGVAEMTEDFEDRDVFEPFSLGGITAQNHKGQLGDWTLYDGDGLQVYGFDGTSVPNLGEPQAAIVLDGTQMFTDPTGFAYSGTQILGSFCPNTASDDWIISPVLPGIAQTIKLFMRQASSVNANDQNYYGLESFEILVSSTDTEVGSFTKIADGKITQADWTQFNYDLPEGTKYFAIHHTSSDIFALYIDDVTFTAAGGSISGFNIYVDQQLVGTAASNVRSFAYSLTGSHEVAVSIIYANGAESKPTVINTGNNAKAGEVTAIETIIAKGEPFDIYSIGGALVRQHTLSVDGIQPGIYVVNNAKVVVK